MRKTVAVAAALVAILGMLAPPVFAQAPAPKVTISGFVDNISSWSHNLSTVDQNYARNGETEWYARTRVRPDITAEVGKTKFVLGLEIDSTWGQTGATDITAPNRFGTSSSWDLNTDTLGNIELKWAYTEFDVPLIPWASRLRMGAQPFSTTYKAAILATGDFAGLHWTTTFNPAVKGNLTYAAIEEESTGPRDGFVRGEDYAIIASLEITPIKGLDLRPIYAFASYDGITSGSSRQGRGGVSNTTAFFPGGNTESRHTLGLDMKWSSGPWSLDPTVFYQFGDRTLTPGAPFTAVGREDQDRSAWLLDIRGGWRSGPLLLEAAFIYTSGNTAGEDVRDPNQEINYYEPINTDTSYYATWAEIWALGIDYFNIMYAASGLNPGVAIGYDKYGLIRLGTRATYALTPNFSLRANLTGNWTAEAVDSSSTYSTAAGLTPGDGNGNSSYLGTEFDLGFTWRFAPGVALDLVGAYMWAGNALSYHLGGASGTVNGRDPQDVQAIATRVRFSF
ncbi:MAG: hypothetical protein HY727_21275 [Candidatus Rokubacteria bacterium]|nr:hypothetical protein [Candidatus Rokubacteria bacterium]